MMDRDNLKSQAIKLRSQGESLNSIKNKLNVSKSTLSTWLRGVVLSVENKKILLDRRDNALKGARKLASLAHKRAKKERIKVIEQSVDEMFEKINFNSDHFEFFLAGLYLGDGFKNAGAAGLGSTNPKILMVFLSLLKHLYKADNTKFSAAIYARIDQREKELIDYWSTFLKIPKDRFHKTQYDKRTRKSKTYINYKGVCTVYYYDVKIKRRLNYIAEKMFGRIAQLVRAPA